VSSPTSTGAQTYKVRSGDTLGAIAVRYGTTTVVLAKLNGIANPSLIRVGQVLQIPPSGVPSPSQSPTSSPVASPTPLPSPTPRPSPTPVASATPTPVVARTYTVQKGDTLAAIAARFGTTTVALAKLNGIADPSYIRVGQVLKLP
jgi:LysM repeat protein